MEHGDSHIREDIFNFLLRKQGEVGEFLLGFVGVLWGLWVANPYAATFVLPSYAAFLSSGIPEWIWGLGYVVLGLATIIAALSKIHNLRLATIFMNILAWMFIAVMFIMAAPANTAFPIYITLSIFAIWLHIRLVVFHELWESYDKAVKHFMGKQE